MICRGCWLKLFFMLFVFAQSASVCVSDIHSTSVFTADCCWSCRADVYVHRLFMLWWLFKVVWIICVVQTICMITSALLRVELLFLCNQLWNATKRPVHSPATKSASSLKQLSSFQTLLNTQVKECTHLAWNVKSGRVSTDRALSHMPRLVRRATMTLYNESLAACNGSCVVAQTVNWEIWMLCT